MKILTPTGCFILLLVVVQACLTMSISPELKGFSDELERRRVNLDGGTIEVQDVRKLVISAERTEHYGGHLAFYTLMIDGVIIVAAGIQIVDAFIRREKKQPAVSK